MAAVDDSIRSKIGKPKKEITGQAIGGEKERCVDWKKDSRAADQTISGRTLVRVARPPVDIMEIYIPGAGTIQKRGRRLGQ
jgi:hypothetical protein